jgi:hypothetical protein
MLLSTCVSTVSLFVLIFYNKETKAFSNEIGLLDNIVFLAYIISTYIYCVLSFSLLQCMNISYIPKSNFFLSLKKMILFIMTLQVLSCKIYNNNPLDTLSLLLTSYYTPVISIEVMLSSVLLLCLYINSVFFFVSYMFFILSLNYDMYYISLNLQVRPDIEYFIDIDDDNEKFI